MTGSRVFPHHLEMLTASGIAEEVIDERGYVTEDTKAGMGRRGFGATQRIVPALVIPLHDVWGQPAGYQTRPDQPRVKDGKPLKYETPIGNRMVLDCPPRVQPNLGDPTRPLFITEGCRKADAAVTAGLDCLALLGVWNWRGSNDDGGKLALPDWEAVALNDRRVYICFDSDVMLKPAVHMALARLKAFLSARHADVAIIYLPPAEGAVKVGLDDFLAAGHGVNDLLAIASPELRPLPTDDGPEPEPEDTYDDVPAETGAVLLDDVAAMLRRFVAFPLDVHAPAVALWIAHTHAVDLSDSTPRLALLSPEKGSGKTRTLEVVAMLARHAKHTMNMTAAYLFRSVESTMPTLLVDEADAIFGPKADNGHEDLRALINAGHRRGAMVGRMVGEGAAMQPKDFSVYCPVALAGIGRLPDTIHDRAVIVHLRRRGPDEHVEPFRHRHVAADAATLHRRLAAWVRRNGETLTDADPTMPAGITDRPADVWEPLLAVADVAGGHWPTTARQACLTLNAARAESDDSIGVQLLGDIRIVFDVADVDRLSSAHLAERLAAIEESPWGDWRGKPIDARWLARRLKPYGIASSSVRIGTSTPKGYLRESFYDAWVRYVDPPPEAATSATRATSLLRGVADANDVAATTATSDRSGSTISPDDADNPSDGGVADFPDVAATTATPDLSATPLTCEVADIAAVALPGGGGTVRDVAPDQGDREVATW